MYTWQCRFLYEVVILSVEVKPFVPKKWLSEIFASELAPKMILSGEWESGRKFDVLELADPDGRNKQMSIWWAMRHLCSWRTFLFFAGWTFAVFLFFFLRSLLWLIMFLFVCSSFVFSVCWAGMLHNNIGRHVRQIVYQNQNKPTPGSLREESNKEGKQLKELNFSHSILLSPSSFCRTQQWRFAHCYYSTTGSQRQSAGEWTTNIKAVGSVRKASQSVRFLAFRNELGGKKIYRHL